MSTCASVCAFVRQRLCLHQCHCLVNSLNMHHSYVGANLLLSTFAYLKPTVSASVSISTSVSLAASQPRCLPLARCYHLSTPSLRYSLNQFVDERFGLNLGQCILTSFEQFVV